MLLLVTILLVVIAAVTLLIGIFSDQLPLIFISIGASALAAIVLAVLSQMSRKKGRAGASDDKPSTSEPTSQGEAEQAAASIEEIGEPITRAAATTAVAPTETAAVAASGPLPIEDYDTLRVNEILPRLAGLDLDELDAIAQHEESGKNRTTVLNRIDALMDELEAAEAAGAGADTPTAVVPAVAVTDEVAEEIAASIEETGEPVVAVDTSDVSASDGFPIANYDQLSEAELIPLLADLDADQLEAVADREEAGPNRDAVLDAIDDRLDILEGIVPAPAAAPEADVAPTPVKRASAKKAPAKKAAAKKAASRTAAEVPTAARKAATKAAPAKATKKTLEPVKKAPAAAAKRTAKAAPAVKKAAATAKKATAKKATAKKATPAKKAAKR